MLNGSLTRLHKTHSLFQSVLLFWSSGSIIFQPGLELPWSYFSPRGRPSTHWPTQTNLNMTAIQSLLHLEVHLWLSNCTSPTLINLKRKSSSTQALKSHLRAVSFSLSSRFVNSQLNRGRLSVFQRNHCSSPPPLEMFVLLEHSCAVVSPTPVTTVGKNCSCALLNPIYTVNTVLQNNPLSWLMLSAISCKKLHCELYVPCKHMLCGHIKDINA